MKKDDKFFGRDELSKDELNGVAGGVDHIKGSKAVVNSKAVDKIAIQTSKIAEAAVIQSSAVTEKPGVNVAKTPDEE